MPPELLAFFGCAIVLMLVVRLVAGTLDGDRLTQYARDQGWEILTRTWTPFGPGWAGSKNERLYDVTYRTPEGAIRRAFVKTSALAGVYVSQDREVKPAPGAPAEGEYQDADSDEAARLRDENAELRRRLAEFEGQRTD